MIFWERAPRTIAITQDDLVDHVAALDTALGPIFPHSVSSVYTHGMIVDKHPVTTPAQIRHEQRMGLHFSRDAHDSHSGLHIASIYTLVSPFLTIMCL